MSVTGACSVLEPDGCGEAVRVCRPRHDRVFIDDGKNRSSDLRRDALGNAVVGGIRAVDVAAGVE